MQVLWWLLAPLGATLLTLFYTSYVERKKQRLVVTNAMHSNYVESQKRRRERLAITPYQSESESVRVLPSLQGGSHGRHRRGR